MKEQKSLKTKATVSKNRNTGRVTIADFKLYYRAVVKKKKKRKKQHGTGKNQIHRPVEYNIGSTSTANWFPTYAKNTHWRKDSLFNKWCW
jgi:hypothetical protein